MAERRTCEQRRIAGTTRDRTGLAEAQPGGCRVAGVQQGLARGGEQRAAPGVAVSMCCVERLDGLRAVAGSLLVRGHRHRVVGCALQVGDRRRRIARAHEVVGDRLHVPVGVA